MDKEKEDLEKMFEGLDLEDEEVSERQWKILKAAVQVFSEKGYGESRTSDIAREAEVAEGTIFRYYKTKKDLLKGLLMPIVVKFFRPLVMRSVERIMRNEKGDSVEKVLRDVFIDRATLAKENTPLIKTVMVESLYHPELLEPIREKLMPQVVQTIDGFIVENIKKGSIRELEPRLVSRTAMSLLAGYLVLTGMYPETFSPDYMEEEIEKMVDILVNGIKNREGDGNNA